MSDVAVAFSDSVLAQLRARAQGHCEGCGRVVAYLEAHHRLFRSRGGLGTVENGAMLCGWGNHTGCHGKAHSKEPLLGWALSRWQDPAAEPFMDRLGYIWVFHKDGTKTRLDRIVEPSADPWSAPSVISDPWGA